MKKICWLTDIHLNFLRQPGAVAAFGQYVAEEHPADIYLVTGDISEAPYLEDHIDRLDRGLKNGWPQSSLYFVLGNHDYYKGSVKGVHEVVANMSLSDCSWLTNSGVVEIDKDTALVGADGFYDAFYGSPYSPRFEMADWELIEEFKAAGKDRQKIIDIARQLSKDSAAGLSGVLEEAASKYKLVLVATHVPPFEEAAWHNGRTSESMWLPWFSSQYMGSVLVDASRKYKDTRFLVMCGHTHSPGVVSKYNQLNLTTLTGKAHYGAPDVAGILDIEEGGCVSACLRLDVSRWQRYDEWSKR